MPDAAERLVSSACRQLRDCLSPTKYTRVRIPPERVFEPHSRLYRKAKRRSAKKKKGGRPTKRLANSPDSQIHRLVTGLLPLTMDSMARCQARQRTRRSSAQPSMATHTCPIPRQVTQEATLLNT